MLITPTIDRIISTGQFVLHISTIGRKTVTDGKSLKLIFVMPHVINVVWSSKKSFIWLRIKPFASICKVILILHELPDIRVLRSGLTTSGSQHSPLPRTPRQTVNVASRDRLSMAVGRTWVGNEPSLKVQVIRPPVSRSPSTPTPLLCWSRCTERSRAPL